jgi:hypothetical protein
MSSAGSTVNSATKEKTKTPANPWLGTVASASKTLAPDKEQMLVFLETTAKQQQLYKADTKALDLLSKSLEKSPDLEKWLKEIGAETPKEQTSLSSKENSTTSPLK